MPFISVDVDVDLGEFSDDELTSEMKSRGLALDLDGDEDGKLVVQWLRKKRWHDLADELERREIRAPVADHEALKRWIEAAGTPA